MANDLVDLLKGLFVPTGVPGPTIQSDAPGTNERDVVREGSDYNRDVPLHAEAPKTPDHWTRKRSSGPGPSGVLGYADHGDPVRIATRMNESTRRRFPDLATHGRPGPQAPEFNIIYDALKSTDAYDKIILGTAHNIWVVGTTTVQAVTLDNALPTLALMNQFPGAIQIYPVLLMFSFGQSVTTATGEYSMAFVPQGGDFPYPLGEYNAGVGGVYNTMRHIIRAPITDPGQTTLGNLIITSNGVTGTPNLFWRMGFGFAAFLPVPAFKGNEPLHVGDWMRGAPEPDAQLAPTMPQGGDFGAGRRS